MSSAAKHPLSHRPQALEQARNLLQWYLTPGDLDGFVAAQALANEHLRWRLVALEALDWDTFRLHQRTVQAGKRIPGEDVGTEGIPAARRELHTLGHLILMVADNILPRHDRQESPQQKFDRSKAWTLRCLREEAADVAAMTRVWFEKGNRRKTHQQGAAGTTGASAA